MSAVAITEQQIVTVGTNTNFSFTKFIYNASGDTVAIPLGSVAAACIPVLGGTAPTVSLAQGNGTNDTATLTGGTAGVEFWLVARHTGGVVTR